MREALKALPACCVDSVVTDPPYHLASIVQRFGSANAAPARSEGATGVYARASAGFMGQQWDGGNVAFQPETWREVWRVLKPGGYLAAFGGTRTSHRLACAIEDAGFEIRDLLMWLYGTGFPKSQNVAKFIDREFGAVGTLGAPRTPEHAAMLASGGVRRGEKAEGWNRPWMDRPEAIAASLSVYVPGTKEGAEWNGWGTALKPAVEPITLARKPLSEKTVAANVLRWRTGALNIDACRVHHEDVAGPRKRHGGGVPGAATSYELPDSQNAQPPGRWPANVVHDGSLQLPSGAERFFYSAKASKADRAGSEHPTVKPIALMQWLVRLLTPPAGVVLDPFAGTGTTGAAAVQEGARCVLIERETVYAQDICRRFTVDSKQSC